MRKFFIALSIMVLVVLISTGIHQKIEKTQINDNKTQETAGIFRNNNI